MAPYNNRHRSVPVAPAQLLPSDDGDEETGNNDGPPVAMLPTESITASRSFSGGRGAPYAPPPLSLSIPVAVATAVAPTNPQHATVQDTDDLEQEQENDKKCRGILFIFMPVLVMLALFVFLVPWDCENEVCNEGYNDDHDDYYNTTINLDD